MNEKEVWKDASQLALECLTRLPEEQGFSELRWLRVFRQPKRITGEEMRAHRANWSILGVPSGRWDQIAAAVNSVIDTRPKTDKESIDAITVLATLLGEVAPLSDGRPRLHLSWASKILAFSWPDRSIHVLDRNARTALVRYRSQKVPPRQYGPFCAAIDKWFMDERQGSGFGLAHEMLVDQVMHHYTINAPDLMQDNVLQDSLENFLARRMFDKHLWLIGAP